MGKVKSSDILRLIEGRLFVADDNTFAETKKTISDLYRMVHSFRKSHSCYRVHTDWRAETEKLLRRTKAKGRASK